METKRLFIICSSIALCTGIGVSCSKEDLNKKEFRDFMEWRYLECIDQHSSVAVYSGIHEDLGMRLETSLYLQLYPISSSFANKPEGHNETEERLWNAYVQNVKGTINEYLDSGDWEGLWDAVKPSVMYRSFKKGAEPEEFKLPFNYQYSDKTIVDLTVSCSEPVLGKATGESLNDFFSVITSLSISQPLFSIPGLQLPEISMTSYLDKEGNLIPNVQGMPLREFLSYTPMLMPFSLKFLENQQEVPKNAAFSITVWFDDGSISRATCVN